MADVSYVITIKNEASGGGTAPSGSAKRGVAKTTQGDSASGFQLNKKQAAMMGVAAVRQIGNRVASVYIDNHVGLAEGHTTLQAKLNYNKQVANRLINIGLPLVVGVATGNPMAVIAAVGSAISWGVDVAVAQDRINIQRSVENVGIGMANVRAGAGGDRSGRNPY